MPTFEVTTLKELPTLAEVARAYLLHVLTAVDWDFEEAAEIIGVTPDALLAKADWHRLRGIQHRKFYQTVTFGMLVTREPLLGELLREAEAFEAGAEKVHRERGGCCADHERNAQWCPLAWWHGWGQHRTAQDSPDARFRRLVGWARKGDPILGTSAAFDLAFDRIFWQALPACCECCRGCYHDIF
jgi:hypothetical protein